MSILGFESQKILLASTLYHDCVSQRPCAEHLRSFLMVRRLQEFALHHRCCSPFCLDLVLRVENLEYEHFARFLAAWIEPLCVLVVVLAVDTVEVMHQQRAGRLYAIVDITYNLQL